MIIRVNILEARANKDNVICKVKFSAIGGPYDGASMIKEFVYPHPTSTSEIVTDLTDYANMLKVSLDAPDDLVGMEFDV